MTTLTRRLVWIGGGVVVVLVIGIVALLLFFPVDKVRTLAVEKASQALDRQVSVADASVSLWGGIGVELQQVALANPESFGGGNVFKARSVDVKLGFWPLLTGDWRVSRLVIDSPSLELIRRKDGTDNFTFGPREKTPSATGQSAPSGESGGAIRADFDRLQIKDAHITYRDERTGNAWGVDGGQLTADLSFPAAGSVHSAGRISLGTVTGTDGKPVLSGAELGYDLDYQKSPDGGASGRLSLSDGRLTWPGFPEPIGPLTARAQFRDGRLSVDELALTAGKSSLKVSGRIDGLLPSGASPAPAPSLDLKVSARAELAELQTWLPPSREARLGGKLAADLHLTGRPDEWRNVAPAGQIEIRDVSYRDNRLPEPLESFSTQLEVAPRAVTIKQMAARFPSGDISLTGKIEDPLAVLDPAPAGRGRRAMVRFDLKSKSLDLDRLLPQAAPGGGKKEPAEASTAGATLPRPPLDGDGSFLVSELTYSGMKFESIHGRLRFNENRIECTDVNSRIFGGGIGGQTAIDLTNPERPTYQGDFSARGVKADEVLSRFTPFGGHLFGEVNLNGDYRTDGLQTRTILDALNVDATSTMQEGTLVTKGVVFQSLSRLASMVGADFQERQPLHDLKVKITVRDQRVQADGLTLNLGDAGEIELNGFYTFGGKVGYDGSLLLSPQWSKRFMGQSGVANLVSGLLGGPSGRLRVPLSLSGTLDNPRMTLDTQGVLENLKRNLVREGPANLLENLFKKKKK